MENNEKEIIIGVGAIILSRIILFMMFISFIVIIVKLVTPVDLSWWTVTSPYWGYWIFLFLRWSITKLFTPKPFGKL